MYHMVALEGRTLENLQFKTRNRLMFSRKVCDETNAKLDSMGVELEREMGIARAEVAS